MLYQAIIPHVGMETAISHLTHPRRAVSVTRMCMTVDTPIENADNRNGQEPRMLFITSLTVGGGVGASASTIIGIERGCM